MTSEPYLTKAELARALRCSTRTIERLGIRPALRVGGQNRYFLSQTEAQLRGEPEEPAEVVPFPSKRIEETVA
jgi:hypothetical protein